MDHYEDAGLGDEKQYSGLDLGARNALEARLARRDAERYSVVRAVWQVPSWTASTTI